MMSLHLVLSHCVILFEEKMKTYESVNHHNYFISITTNHSSVMNIIT